MFRLLILRPPLYVALVVAVHCLILLLPAALPVFKGPAHTTAFLLASFALALPAMFWPGLKVKHLGVILLALAGIEPLVWFGFTLSFPVAADELINDTEFHGWTDIFRSLGIQVFISFVMAMGLWMRGRYDQFTLRRGGSDREERSELFDLKQNVLPEEHLTYLRYAKLMECGVTLIGEQLMRMRGALQAFQRDEILFLYDLIRVPGEPECREELLRMALQRPEFQQAARGRVYLVGNDPPETTAILRELGFRRVDSGDAELLFQIRQRLGGVLADEFKTWRPFTEVQEYYYQHSDEVA